MNEQRVKQDVTLKRKSIEARIVRIEAAMKLASDYLATGEHADWHGFRPLFVRKVKNGKPCPPHNDWVKNVFLRSCRRQLADAERALERLEH